MSSERSDERYFRIFIVLTCEEISNLFPRGFQTLYGIVQAIHSVSYDFLWAGKNDAFKSLAAGAENIALVHGQLCFLLHKCLQSVFVKSKSTAVKP